jgi:hypothetical protein
MPERETGNERFARLDREAQTYLAAMPDAERRALRAAWEAQRPIMELAVGTPPSRFINCWAAARAFAAARGGTEDGEVIEADAERLIDKLLDYGLLGDSDGSERMVIACDLIRTIRRGGTEEERPTMDQHAAVIEAVADARLREDELREAVSEWLTARAALRADHGFTDETSGTQMREVLEPLVRRCVVAEEATRAALAARAASTPEEEPDA